MTQENLKKIRKDISKAVLGIDGVSGVGASRNGSLDFVVVMEEDKYSPDKGVEVHNVQKKLSKDYEAEINFDLVSSDSDEGRFVRDFEYNFK